MATYSYTDPTTGVTTVYTVTHNKSLIDMNSVHELRLYKVTLKDIAPDDTHLDTAIINGNTVLKNIYLESVIVPIIGITSTAPALPATTSVQSKEWRYYYNPSTNQLMYTKPVLTNGEVTGMTNWAVKSNFTTPTEMQNHVGLILVNEENNKLYHWHNNQLNVVGGGDIALATSIHSTDPNTGDPTVTYTSGTITLEMISQIASRIAVEMVTSAQGGQFEDKLYQYTEITDPTP